MKKKHRSLLCALFLGLSFALPSLGAQQGGFSPLWRQALSGAVIGEPVAQAESVAVVCDGGMVHSYSPSGRSLWTYSAQGRLSPYITRSAEGTTYICRTNGLFIALNRVGRELWRANLGSPLVAPVLVGWDGRIFIPLKDRIACYTASGFLLWSRQLNAPPALRPQPDKLGSLLTVKSDGEILILGPYGSVRERKLGEVPAVLVPLDTAAARSIAPAASKAAADAVKAMAEEAASNAAEAEAAAIRTRSAADRAAATAKAIPANNEALAAAKQAEAKQAEDTAVAAARNAEEMSRLAEEAARRQPPVFDGYEQTVLAIYPGGRSESIRWYNNGESSFAAAFPSLGSGLLGAVNREDTIAAALADGSMLLFSVAEGKTLWTAGSHIVPADGAGVRLVYDERGIYALTNSGATGYGVDGKQLWSIRLRDGAAVPPAFSDEGILYAGGSDWILNAYNVEDTMKIRKQTLYGPAAEGSYGGGDPRPSPWAEDYDRYEWATIGDRLKTISTAIRNGRVGGNEKSYAAYLMEVADSVARAPANRNRLHPPVHVHHRAEAARLLSYIGSRETIPFLANLCRSDPDPLVKAAAAEAIGSIGVDPDGVALAAFISLVFPLIPGRDEQVMTAIAMATGALCRFSGPPMGESGARLLSALAGMGPGLTQAVALRELNSLYY
jgi:hypothetical protein